MNIKNLTPAEQIVSIMTAIYDLKMTTPSGGNISIKDDEGNVWVTPSQIDKGTLKPEDIIKITPDMEFIGKHKPTSEYPFHLGIYRKRPDIKSVTHAHPTGLVAFSAAHRTAKFNVLPVLSKHCNNIGYSDYAIPGSEQLGKNVAKTFADGFDAATMENHGIITAGNDVVEAFNNMVSAELLANIYIDALKIGKTVELSEDQIKLSENKTYTEAVEAFTGLNDSLINEKKEELLYYVKRCLRRGLISNIAGSLSIRVDEKTFIIIPGDCPIEFMDTDDLVLVVDGKSEKGKVPDYFVDIHTAIYNKNSHVNSIATALPRSMMAYAISDKEFDSRTIPESYIFLSKIPTFDFESRYNDIEALAEKFTIKSPNALLQNQCFVVTGDNPFQVFDRLEVAEFTARSVIDSIPLGDIVPMSDEAIQEIIKVYMS